MKILCSCSRESDRAGEKEKLRRRRLVLRRSRSVERRRGGSAPLAPLGKAGLAAAALHASGFFWFCGWAELMAFDFPAALAGWLAVAAAAAEISQRDVS